MAAIITRRRWRSPPPGRVEINRANPITEGLAVLHYVGASDIELASSTKGTLSGSFTQGDGGVGLVADGTNIALNFGSTLLSPGTGTYTVLAYADPDNGAKVGLIAQSAASPQMAIIANTDATFGTVAGSVMFYDYNSAQSNVVSVVGTSQLTSARKPRVFIGRRLSTDARQLIIDGTVINTAGTGLQNNISGGSFGIGGLPGFTGYSGANSRSYLTAAWTRDLSDLETVELADPANLWQLVRPMLRRTYFVVPAAASGTLKTWNGLTRANIKTVDSLAIASAKSYNTLTP